MAGSYDISKTVSRLLKPRVSCGKHEERARGIQAEPFPIRRSAEDRNGSRLLDGECKRVQIKPYPVGLWNARDRVEDRGHEKRDGNEKSDCVADVADKHSDRGHEHCESEHGKNVGCEH